MRADSLYLCAEVKNNYMYHVTVHTPLNGGEGGGVCKSTISPHHIPSNKRGVLLWKRKGRLKYTESNDRNVLLSAIGDNGNTHSSLLANNNNHNTRERSFM